MRLKEMHLIVEDEHGREQTAKADFGSYGWQQWGATTDVLAETMPVLEALSAACMDDPGLTEFLYGDNAEQEPF